jgi:hypothetical protein
VIITSLRDLQHAGVNLYAARTQRNIMRALYASTQSAGIHCTYFLRDAIKQGHALVVLKSAAL